MLTRRTLGAAVAAVLLFAQSALADPPIWESDFGAVIDALTLGDDETAGVVTHCPQPTPDTRNHAPISCYATATRSMTSPAYWTRKALLTSSRAGEIVST